MSTEFIVILKQVHGNAPQMFIQKNDFVTDNPIGSIRHNSGEYTLTGFSFDGEGLLPFNRTEIYFGNGNEASACRWVKLEGNNPENPAQEINIFTKDDDGFGQFSPADNLLDYVTLKIVVNP